MGSLRTSYGNRPGGSLAFVASLSAGRFQALAKGSIDGSTYGMTVTRGGFPTCLSESSAG